MKKLVIAPIHHFYIDRRSPLPKRMRLESGYILQAFDDSVLNEVFDFFGQSYSERDKEELRNCRYAIYFGYQTPDEGSEIPPSTLNDIIRIVQSLRVVKRTRALPSILHFRIRRRRKEPLQIVHKPFANITLPPTLPGGQHFSREDAKKIRLYWRRVKYLYDTYGGAYQKVLNGFFFFELGHQNHLYKPRFVHFVTCLESLFNTSGEQIAHSLRIRCSYFLERNSNARLALAREIKEIYNLRSLFVHGQATHRRILNNPQRQEQLLITAEDISRRCLQKIFDNDLIQIFGDINRLNSEFENLELGLPSALR